MATTTNNPGKYFKDLLPEGRKLIAEQIIKRQEVLNAGSSNALGDAKTFLYTSNGGGAAAMLAYIGTGSTAISIESQIFSLSCFGFGLLLYGLLIARLLQIFRKSMWSWSTDSIKCINSEITLQELDNRGNAEAKKTFWAYFLGYFSRALFIIGIYGAAFDIRKKNEKSPTESSITALASGGTSPAANKLKSNPTKKKSAGESSSERRAPLGSSSKTQKSQR